MVAIKQLVPPISRAQVEQPGEVSWARPEQADVMVDPVEVALLVLVDPDLPKRHEGNAQHGIRGNHGRSRR